MRRWILSLLCALLLAAPAAAGPGSGPLRIAYLDFPAFHWRDQQGRMHGLYYEIIREAVERRMGLAVVWESQPWARCQASIREGLADAMLTVPTEERSQYALASGEPFYIKEHSVFTYAGHPRLAEIRNLRTVEDIRRTGFSVITYHENGWNKANVEPLGIPVLLANTLRSVWSLLAEQRGDLVIEWPPAAWPDIQALKLERRIVQTDTVMVRLPFHLYVGKRSRFTGILPGFDRAIQAMREDGTMDRIIKDWR